MAPPSFLATPFRRRSVASVTDVQSILDAVADELKVQLPVEARWSELAANRYKSPPDPAGRFMEVTLSRISVTALGFKVVNQNGLTIIDGRVDISGTASAVIWSGPYHLWVQTIYGATTYEVARASLLDPRPEDLSSHPYYVAANTHRTAAGSLISNADKPWHWHLEDYNGAQNLKRGTLLTLVNTSFSAYLAFETGEEAVCGSRLVRRMDASLNHRSAGYLFQTVVVSRQHSPGVQLPVPIDDGVTGLFEVTGLIAEGVGRLAVRAG